MVKQHKYFVTGIGTEVGKTIVSSILVEALKADYWKPVQAGFEPSTDSLKIKILAPSHQKIFPETYMLKAPLSPHASAPREGVEIDLNKFKIPITNNHLIVEGAGGILVPLNERETMTDLMVDLDLPVVLVSRHYLGSINHSLLSIEHLKSKNIPIHLLVFVGDNPETESIILKLSGVKNYIKIPEVGKVDLNFVQEQSKRILPFLFTKLKGDN